MKERIEKKDVNFKTLDKLSQSFHSLLKELICGLPNEGKEIFKQSKQFELQSVRKPFNAQNIITKLEKASNFNIKAVQKDRSLFILLKETSSMFDKVTFDKLNFTLEDTNIVDIFPRSVFYSLNKLEELDVFIEYVNKLEMLKNEESLLTLDNATKNKVVSITESSLENKNCNQHLVIESDEITLQREILVSKIYKKLYENCLNCETFEDENLKNYARNKLEEINYYLEFLNKEKLKVIK